MSDIDFSHQISSLQPSLHTFTKRFTRDQDESSDLVQETILKALTYKDKFKENTNLKGWLFTIMRNTFINNYRKTRRFKSVNDGKSSVTKGIIDKNTFNNPASNYEYHDIWKHINSLSEELLIPFKLYTSGFKYHEIAENQQMPIGTVKNRIFNARKEIQKKLAG